MAAVKHRREKRARQFVQAAFLDDIEHRLGEMLGETQQAEIVQMSDVIQTKKGAAPKIPYGAAIVLGATCPDCGADVAQMQRDGKPHEICTRQFDAEPGCGYERVLPS